MVSYVRQVTFTCTLIVGFDLTHAYASDVGIAVQLVLQLLLLRDRHPELVITH